MVSAGLAHAPRRNPHNQALTSHCRARRLQRIKVHAACVNRSGRRKIDSALSEARRELKWNSLESATQKRLSPAAIFDNSHHKPHRLWCKFVTNHALTCRPQALPSLRPETSLTTALRTLAQLCNASLTLFSSRSAHRRTTSTRLLTIPASRQPLKTLSLSGKGGHGPIAIRTIETNSATRPP